MKWYLFTSLLAFTVSMTVSAKDQSADEGRAALISEETAHDRLFSVMFEGDRGLAVGEAGLLKYTTDGGNTWVRQQAPTELALLDVAKNGNRTIAVGQMGLILIRDGDGAWTKVKSGTKRRLLRVDVNQNGLAMIVGSFGTLLKSSDNGGTWESIAPAWQTLYESGEGAMAVTRDEPTNYVVDVLDDGSAIIGGEYGQLMFSPDGGSSWRVVYRFPVDNSENGPTLFELNVRSDGAGFAVGQAGLALRTSDGGKTWTRLKTGVTAGLYAVESTPDGQVAIVGQRVALRSTDNGEHWESVDALDLTLNWYSGLGRGVSTPAGEFIAVGHSGRVIRLVR